MQKTALFALPLKLLEKLETIQPFTEAEAWAVFRIAALSEAGGWTLLIAGIVMRDHHLPGGVYAVQIAGQIHGMIFLAYFGALIATYTSLRWSRKKFLVAIIAGVPPYGTFLFEQWAAWKRHNTQSQIHFQSLLFLCLAQKN